MLKLKLTSDNIRIENYLSFYEFAFKKDLVLTNEYLNILGPVMVE
jgi:hypothetical protein